MDYQKNVSDYYKQTQNHYQKWWKLDSALSLHYGIWDETTPDFLSALANTNHIMAKMAGAKKGERILDAGCGVGGAAIFLAKEFNAKVTGITLSAEQQKRATQSAKDLGATTADFQVQDYLNTHFANETFDVVWACESMTSAPNKLDFVIEVSRLLKPGGRLVVSDFFLSPKTDRTKEILIQKWEASWAMNDFLSTQTFIRFCEENKMVMTQDRDFTKEITPSAKRMYHSYYAGLIPSEIYNLFHPKVSRYARHHYKSGLWQYKALKKKLWEYHTLVFEKAQ